jgi:hypothetical protein
MPRCNDAIQKAVRICGRASKAVQSYKENEPFVSYYMQMHSLKKMRVAGYEVRMENDVLSFESYDPNEWQMMFEEMMPIDYSKLQGKLF